MLEGFVDITEVLRGGIYVLLCKGTVVYVGKSNSFGRRLFEHQMKGFKYRGPKLSHSKIVYGDLPMAFDSMIVKVCEPSEADELEIELIEHYRPRYNSQFKPTLSRALSQRCLASGIVAQIIAGTHQPRPQAPEAPRPLINRRGL